MNEQDQERIRKAVERLVQKALDGDPDAFEIVAELLWDEKEAEDRP